MISRIIWAKQTTSEFNRVILPCLGILSLIFCVSGCKHKKPDVPVKKPGEYYYLHVGKQLLEGDGYLIARNEPFDYRITVYLNGNPICNMKESTGIFALNEFIQPGENHVQLVTEGSQPIEAAVTSTPNFESQVIKGRGHYDPNENSLECGFSFSANIDYTLPIYLPENHLPTDKKEITDHVLSLLESAFQAVEKENYKKFAQIILEGERLYSPCAFGISAHEIDRQIPQFNEDHTFSRGYFQRYVPQEYVITYGESLILVYRKDFENVLYRQDFSDLPTIIACINGKYIMWLARP